MFKVGDRVRMRRESKFFANHPGEISTIESFNYDNGEYRNRTSWNCGTKCYRDCDLELINGGTMFKEVSEYLKSNKSVILTVVFALVLDQLVFKGAFREKVKELVEGLLGKAKKELEGTVKIDKE